jgi:hypothetical protein
LLKVDVFKKVLEYYKGADLPEMKYLGNTLSKEFQLDTSFHEEFSQVFRENCACLQIGSGFTVGNINSESKSGAPKSKAEVGSPTIVVAEPDEKTGRVCFVAMPFRERDSSHAAGFFGEVLRVLITPSGRDAGFEVRTANREGSDVIQATIVNELLEADLVIADLTENNPNVLFELGMRIAEDKPVALIRAKGTPPIFDVDNMLRVYEYDPNIWPSTVQHDLPRMTEHVRAAWNDRESNQTYMKILRSRTTKK